MTLLVCSLLGLSCVLLMSLRHWHKRHDQIPVRSLLARRWVASDAPSPVPGRLAFGLLFLAIFGYCLSNDELARGEWTFTKALLLASLFFAGQLLAHWLRRK